MSRAGAFGQFRLGLEVEVGSPSPLEHTSHAKSSCAHSSQVEPRLLQPLSLSQQFSGQPRGLASFTQDPRTGMPSLWLNPLTPWGGSLPIRSPFSSETPPGGTGPDSSLLLSSKKFVLFIYVQEQLVKKLRGHNKTHSFRNKHFTLIQKIEKRKSKAKEISFKATARVQA